MNQEIAGIGHNVPNTPEALIAYLHETNEDLKSRAAECLEKANQTPDECRDDDLESIITDRIGAIQKTIKSLDAGRTSTKEPYLTLERAVDGFFNYMISDLKKAKERLSGIGGEYKARKAEIERQRAVEEAARQRLERETAERKAQEEAKVARELREEAERIRKEAERRVHEAEERAAAEAREAQELRDEAERIRADSEKQTAENIKRAAELDAQAKAQEKAAKQELKAAVDSSGVGVAKELDRQAKAAEKSSEQNINQAVHLEKQENKSTAIAEGRKAPSSTRSYGSYGSQGGLRVSIKGHIVDRQKLDPATIFPFIADDALQVALNRWIQANSRGESLPVLAGAKFWADEQMTVRS